MPPNSACQNILNVYATIDYQGVFPSVFSVPLNFTLTITGGSGKYNGVSGHCGRHFRPITTSSMVLTTANANFAFAGFSRWWRRW